MYSFLMSQALYVQLFNVPLLLRYIVVKSSIFLSYLIKLYQMYRSYKTDLRDKNLERQRENLMCKNNKCQLNQLVKSFVIKCGTSD